MSEEVLRMVRCAVPSLGPIYLTSRRMIVAPFSTNWRWWFLFGAVGWSIAVHREWKKAMRNMSLSPTEIMNASRESYQIPNNDVTEIRVTKQTTWRNPKLVVSTEAE